MAVQHKNARRAASRAPVALTIHHLRQGQDQGQRWIRWSAAGSEDGSVRGWGIVRAQGQPDYVLGLRPPLAMDELELDLLTLAERLVAFLLDGGEVDKDVPRNEELFGTNVRVRIPSGPPHRTLV